MKTIAPRLLEIPGCGIVSAATLVGEAANVDRFKDEAAFARFGGVAPIPKWTGDRDERMIMSRRGNRRVRQALYRIATTQVRMKASPGAAYYRKRRDAGDPPAKAMRCLKRRIARVVFHRLRSDYRKRVAGVNT
ncbi:MAG: transposase [Candidatus Sericytochromatia bacterium]